MSQTDEGALTRKIGFLPLLMFGVELFVSYHPAVWLSFMLDRRQCGSLRVANVGGLRRATEARHRADDRDAG